MEDLNEIDFDIDFEDFPEERIEAGCVVEEREVPSISDDISLSNIPEVVFVNETGLVIAIHEKKDKKKKQSTGEEPAASSVDMKKAKECFKCECCQKSYTRRLFFDKHKELCTQETSNPAPDKKTLDVDDKSYMDASFGLLRRSLESAVSDPFFKISESGIAVGQLANIILELCGNESGVSVATEFAQLLAQRIIKCIKIKPTRSSQREEIISSFHKATIDTNLLSAWQSFLCTLSVNDTSSSGFLFQHVLNKFLQYSLEFRNKLYLAIDSCIVKEEDLKLSVAEEQSLRYVSGYILYSLRKAAYAYNNIVTRQTILSLIAMWGAKGENSKVDMDFLTYTREWVKKVNRGGLYEVNDEFYLFVRRIENMARTLLNTKFMVTYAGDDMRSVLVQRLQENEPIDVSWTGLTRNLENKEFGLKLKVLILRKWANIRVNAFVRAWVLVARRKASWKLQSSKDAKAIEGKGAVSLRKSLATPGKVFSEKGEPSLRKTLGKSAR